MERNSEENNEKIIAIDPCQVEGIQEALGEYRGKVYTIKGQEGFYFIPNQFTVEQQKFWIKRCITEYCVGLIYCVV